MSSFSHVAKHNVQIEWEKTWWLNEYRQVTQKFYMIFFKWCLNLHNLITNHLPMSYVWSTKFHLLFIWTSDFNFYPVFWYEYSGSGIIELSVNFNKNITYLKEMTVSLDMVTYVNQIANRNLGLPWTKYTFKNLKVQLTSQCMKWQPELHLRWRHRE